jgi:hypothetical protein
MPRAWLLVIIHLRRHLGEGSRTGVLMNGSKKAKVENERGNNNGSKKEKVENERGNNNE